MTYKILPSDLSLRVIGLNVPFAFESATVSATAADATVPYYIGNQSVLYYTAEAAGNWAIDITWDDSTTLDNKMTDGQAMTMAFMVTQGATPYYNDNVLVDGSTSGVTVFWQGGAAPTAGNASGIDVYAYTVIKTDIDTFTVLASQTQFA